MTNHLQTLLYRLAGTGINFVSLLSPHWSTAKLMNLFSVPPKPHIRPKELAFLNTAKQLRNTYGNTEIVEYHWGDDGNPLVLLSYGWGYNAGRWRHFTEALLAAGFRVVAFDPPGHGLLPPAQVNLVVNAGIIQGLLEKYGPAEVMIGHSFGGASGIFALQHTARYLHPKRMVLMASFSHTPTVLRSFADRLGLWDLTFNRMIKAFEEYSGLPIRQFDQALMSSGLSHIQGLIVHSPGDEVTPFSNALRYHNFWKNSYLYAPTTGGHHLGTAAITEAVLGFAIDGKVPEAAYREEKNPAADHELIRFYPGT
jgi:pimeloyl-ACP methyl ester carboxylesterase